MLKGIYTPLSGAIAQERYLEIISNNLANINTNGFKGDNITFTVLDPKPNKNYVNPLPPANYKNDLSEFLPPRDNEMSYVGVAEISRDFTQGPVISTGSNTDLLVQGKGHFLVQTTNGERLTRDGSFTLNSEGILTTKGGHPVMGERGNIQLKSGSFEVNFAGEIYQKGKLVDRLSILELKDPKQLERAGENLLFHTGDPENISKMKHPNILQGKVEGSNVNAIKNMTAMILAHRSYEAYQKAVSHFDQMMDKSSNSIGEVRA